MRFFSVPILDAPSRTPPTASIPPRFCTRRPIPGPPTTAIIPAAATARWHQINQSNVSQLTLAWVAPMHSSAIKSTPLVVNGILYLTTPDNVWAVDARTGRIRLALSPGFDKATTSASAASVCIRTGLYFRHRRLPPDFAQRQRRQSCAGTSNSPIPSSATSPPWRRW